MRLRRIVAADHRLNQLPGFIKLLARDAGRGERIDRLEILRVGARDSFQLDNAFRNSIQLQQRYSQIVPGQIIAAS